MPSTTKPAPTSVDAAELAIRIQGKLEQAKRLLVEASKDASALAELTVEHAPFVRFNRAIIDEAEWLGDYLGDNDTGSVFDIGDAMKSVNELLELMTYADLKDN